MEIDGVDYRPLAESQDPFDHLKLNLHQFFNHVYKYYEQKGFLHILLSQLLSTIAVEFALGLLFFTIFCVNIDQLVEGKSLALAVQSPNPVASAVFGVLAILYFLYRSIRSIFIIHQSWQLKKYYQNVLEMNDDDVQTAPWSEVVNRLRQDRLDGIPKSKITSLDIIKIMMRKDNYMIGMLNQNILNLSLPCTKSTVVTQVIEWCLSFALLNQAFDKYGRLHPEYLQAANHDELAAALKRRFFWTGLIFLILSPFVLILLLVYAFFTYTAQIKVSPNILGARTWSALARWKFRNFNETPSAFNNRLNKSYEFAEKYVEQFQSPALTAFASFGLFIVGAVVAVLVVLTLIWDHLLEATIAGRTVLWILGVGGAVVGALRLLLPPDNFVYEPNELMEEIAKHTNYIPLDWIDKAHTRKVRDEFLSYFQYKVVVFLLEILSVVFAPLIFMFSLPKSADDVIRFLREMSVEEEGVGTICKLASFDMGENGNRDYGAEPSTSDPTKHTQHGKLEMSVVAFKANHPEWEPEIDATRKFLHGVMEYQRSETLTRTMEQKNRHSVRLSRPAGFFDIEAQNENLPADLSESIILMSSDRVRGDRSGRQPRPESTMVRLDGGVASL